MELPNPANDAPTPVRSAEWIELRAKPGLADWPDEDITWLEHFKPLVCKPVVERYGRKVMELVMVSGTIGHGLQIIGASRPPAKVMNALGVLSLHINAIMTLALKAQGVDVKIFESCREDLDRLAALQDDGQGGKKSAGGIILAS